MTQRVFDWLPPSVTQYVALDPASASPPLAGRSALTGVMAAVCLGVALIAVARSQSISDVNGHNNRTGMNQTSDADDPSKQEGKAIAEEDGFRIDPAADTPEWKKMIARSLELPQIRSGRGQMTLMRMLLEDGAPDTLLQLTGTKLLLPARGTGGGRYQQIRSGGFVLLDHVNTTRRRQGKDPVEIGTFSHYRPTIWVPVPPRGMPGVLGDVILSPFPAERMGRIVATVSSEAKRKALILCPISSFMV